MDEAKLDDWTSNIDRILFSSRQFMNSCNPHFGRGFIGELLVFQELLRCFKADLLFDAKIISPKEKMIQTICGLNIMM